MAHHAALKPAEIASQHETITKDQEKK